MLFKKSVSNIFQINAFTGDWAWELSIFARAATDSVNCRVDKTRGES